MTEIFQKECSYENGKAFRQEELENYYIDYVEGSKKSHLIIVFDGSNLNEDIEAWQRYPWGVQFLNAEGYSVIGVKVKKIDWFRGEDLHLFFVSDAFQDFIEHYDNVCLYGPSMGGYGALALAGAIQGAKVLSIGPQSTMDPRVVPWESRYQHAREQDWDGYFADAATTLNNIDVAYVVYDPFFGLDRAHINRLPQEKIVHLKTPFLGHAVTPKLSEMDLLKPLFQHFIAGDVETWFPKAIRARKNLEKYEYSALILWSLRLYKRGDAKQAKSTLENILEKNPGDAPAEAVLDAINKGQKVSSGL